MHTRPSDAPLAIDRVLQEQADYAPRPWKEEFPPFVVQGAAEAVCEGIPTHSPFPGCYVAVPGPELDAVRKQAAERADGFIKSAIVSACESAVLSDCEQIADVSAESGKLSILAEADAIAGENRSRDYGHPLANHRRIANIWNIQLEKKLAAPLTPSDVATLMIGLKLARLISSPCHRDSFVDIAGYVKCWDMIQEAGGE